MPSTRRTARPVVRPFAHPLARGGGVLASLALGVLGFVGVAAAQTSNPGAELNLGLRFGIVAVVNLLLAGALVGLGPRYATKTVNEIRDDPAGAFGWGLLVGIGVPIGLVLLAVTIIGLVVAIPGFILLAFVGLIGSAVSIVWVGALLTGTDGGGGKAALVGALVLAVPGAIPVLGRLVTTLVSFFGLGVVGRDLYKSWRD